MVGSVREAHLARSAEPALAFGNDADDMRGAGRGIDPRVMVDDMSSDAMAYAKSRFELISDVQGELLSRYSEDGDTWAELRSAYLVLMRQMQLKPELSLGMWAGSMLTEQWPAQAMFRLMFLSQPSIKRVQCKCWRITYSRRGST